MRGAAEYLVTHGKLFKDQGISLDKTWAENDKWSNNDDINEGSMLQIGTNIGEPHINGRAIFCDNPGEPQPACSDWNNSVNLALKEGKKEFGTIVGVDEPQPGCSRWDDSLNRDGQMEFRAITGAVSNSAAISDDENEIRGVVEFRVIIGDGDEIEMVLEPRNVRAQ